MTKVKIFLKKIIEKGKEDWNYLKKRSIPLLLLALLVIILAGGISAFFFEKGALNEGLRIRSIGDAFWWTIVTLTTVGYGDKVPLTLGGRLIGVFLMFVGIGLVTLLTATVSSVFVEKKIREGKGLEIIKLKDHFVICGWHSNGEAVLEALIKATAPTPTQIVLINELGEEKINALKYKYEQIQIKFVKGDFTHEGTLRLAAIREAKAIVILSDISGNHSLEEADRRIVLATLAIKTINSRVKVCAEMLNPENEEHLRRANVDDIILSGKYNDFLLANAALSTGVLQATEDLLSFEGNVLSKVKMPAHLTGKTFKEAFDHFRKESGSLLIGTVREEKRIGLNDILTDDYSAIDQFIKRKFQESEEDYFKTQSGLKVNTNPCDDYQIKEDEMAIVITKGA